MKSVHGFQLEKNHKVRVREVRLFDNEWNPILQSRLTFHVRGETTAATTETKDLT